MQQPRLRAPLQPLSRLAVLLLSKLPPALLSQHPLDLTLVVACHVPSLEHQSPIILHHRWEASTLGLLLLTNQLSGHLHHPSARVLLVQFPLEVLELQSKASMLFLSGLQRLPPSLSGLDRSHLEHGRGCRRGGNTTGRSNLLLASYKPFRGLKLLLQWLIWVTLLCSKPDIPKPGCHHALCFLPSSIGLCWPETLCLQRSWKERTSLLSSCCLDDYMTQRGNVAMRR